MLTTTETPPPLTPREDDGSKGLWLVIRQALLMIVVAIEKRYGMERKY